MTGRYEVRECHPFGGWGVWCNHRRWWATLNHTPLYGLSQTTARTAAGMLTESVRPTPHTDQQPDVVEPSDP